MDDKSCAYGDKKNNQPCSSGAASNGPKRWRTYFIYAPEVRQVRIGKSTDVGERLTVLQLGSPARLVLIGSVSQNIESLLHRRFAEYRINGEWFDVRGRLQDFLYDKFRLPKPCVPERYRKRREQLVALYECKGPIKNNPDRKVWRLRWIGDEGKRYCDTIGEVGKMPKREATSLRREKERALESCEHK